MLFQILVCFLHFRLVSCIRIGTRNDTATQFNEIVPCSHKFINIVACLQHIQLIPIVLYKALLCQNALTVFPFCVKYSLCKISIRCRVISIAVNLTSLVNTCLRGEREGEFLFFKFLSPYYLSLVAIQQITEFATLDILCGNLGRIALMRTELVDKIAVGTGDIIWITGKGIGITLTCIHFDTASKGTVRKG